MTKITVHQAVAGSRLGKVLGRNCQDAVSTIVEEVGAVGILCDGCGSQPHSEVGAYLTSQFIAETCIHLLKDRHFSLRRLHGDLVEYYRSVARSTHPHTTSASRQFVIESLLTTVNGFVYTPEITTIFSSGDGVRQIDQEIEVIDHNNQPDYLAYELLDGKPRSFSFRVVSQVGKIAVCSDAWSNQLHLIQHAWGLTHPDGLQRLVNVYSKNRIFTDDASIITLEVER